TATHQREQVGVFAERPHVAWTDPMSRGRKIGRPEISLERLVVVPQAVKFIAEILPHLACLRGTFNRGLEGGGRFFMPTLARQQESAIVVRFAEIGAESVGGIDVRLRLREFPLLEKSRSKIGMCQPGVRIAAQRRFP